MPNSAAINLESGHHGREEVGRAGIFDFIRVVCGPEKMAAAARECRPALKVTGNVLIGPIPHTEVEAECAAFYAFKSEGYSLRNRIIMHSPEVKGYHSFLWFSLVSRPYFDLDSVRVPQRYPNKKAYKGKNKGKLSGNPLGKNPGDCWTLSEMKLSLDAAIGKLSVALCPSHGLKMVVQ